MLPIISATGLTFKEEPITINKSHISLSFWKYFPNSSGNFSPKKIILG